MKSGHAHVLMASFLLGLTAAFFLGISETLKQAEASIRPHLQVSVFVQPTASDEAASKLGDVLKSHDSEIRSLTYISKAAAYQAAIKDPTLAKSLMVLNENPLPAVYLLDYSDNAWLERQEPAQPLNGLPLIQEIRWDAQGGSLYRSLRQGRAWLVRLSVCAIAALTVWAVYGLARVRVLGASVRSLGTTLAVGAFGGALAATLWCFSTRALGNEGALFHLRPLSPWPVVVGLIVGLALVGENLPREN